MKTTQIKKKLIEKINKTEDTGLLKELHRIIDMEAYSEDPYQLSNEQKSAIYESRQQIKEGKILTNEEANAEIEEWLRK